MANPTGLMRSAPALRLLLPRTDARIPRSSPALLLHHPAHQRLQTRPTAAASASLHTQPARRRRHHRATGPDGEPVPDAPPETDFERLDVLGATPVPATSVDACLPDGFKLSGGVSIYGGCGALLVGGEAFAWQPWLGGAAGAAAGGGGAGPRLLNERGQWEVPEEAFGLLGLVWPRPDLLILGLGPEMRPLSPATRKHISSLGMRVDVLDTRNAASQFNLLATERGVADVAAALIPIGWKEGVGAR
ncbi:hypothetical protein QBC33DRAFT_513310 [Phialemonium atrogriseum]|uniref:NADH dehydrogenase [ubiquinone] 1 alpha subcomplex assembly factor 3 n=1 Tax=Phialemonium atrogriseum TaxID=1093897 RepID=A0AAJ0C353_9PEZI|nr:uncharacterized protein QBC33DRAFT_513310 [Phialemonium atrogriseum]KAK1769066.1 hypothetical protein QBC33DRAFT_513310 [Phialemonium atrogriseum]